MFKKNWSVVSGTEDFLHTMHGDPGPLFLFYMHSAHLKDGV